VCHTPGVPPHGLLAALNLALVDLCHVHPGMSPLISIYLVTYATLLRSVGDPDPQKPDVFGPP
jgi:hypothetical protein